MKDIDFLPESFVQARRRRYLLRRNLLYSAAVAAGLIGLHTINSSRLRAAEAALGPAQSTQAQRDQQQKRLEVLRGLKRTLARQSELVSRLDDAAPLDAVIGEINRLMEPGMALRSLSVETVVPEASASASPAASPSPAGKAEAPVEETRGALSGLATSDVQVGVFFARLSECPLFTDVVMSYSREAREGGPGLREFEFKFVVRRVTLPPGTGGL